MGIINGWANLILCPLSYFQSSYIQCKFSNIGTSSNHVSCMYTYREKKRKMIRFFHYKFNGLLYMYKVGRFHDQPEQVAKDKKLRLYLTSLPLEDSQWSSWHPNGLAKPRCPHRRNISAFLYLHLWILLYIVLPPIHPSSEHLLLRGLGLPFELSDLS